MSDRATGITVKVTPEVREMAVKAAWERGLSLRGWVRALMASELGVGVDPPGRVGRGARPLREDVLSLLGKKPGIEFQEVVRLIRSQRIKLGVPLAERSSWLKSEIENLYRDGDIEVRREGKQVVFRQWAGDSNEMTGEGDWRPMPDDRLYPVVGETPQEKP
jgi:hypothetical protein